MKVSVIIVNYNVRFFLEQCLISVLKASRGLEAEVIVVDNASTDGSRAYLEPRFPEVRFIWNTVNLGFSKANNQGLTIARGAYLLFLNPDTIVPEDCFHACINFFREHPDAGGLGIRMIDGSGQFLRESRRAFPSPLTAFFKLTGLAELFPRSPVFGRYHLGHLDPAKSHETDVLAGAFLMASREAIAQTGGFDETFFMYGEDIDLSYRIQRTGLKNYYFAGQTIIHFKGESTRKGTLNYVRLFYRAMSIFVSKHLSGFQAGLFQALIHIAIWLRAGVSFLAGFLRKAGLPLIDAALILLSFWAAKFLWSHFVKPDILYSKQMLTIAFPLFTLLYLIAAYYTGLYDKTQRRFQLTRSTIFATCVLLIFYALLPERFRFSRAILLLGSLVSYLLLMLSRFILRRLQVIEAVEKDERLQTVVVGTMSEYERVRKILKLSGKENRILGRVSLAADGGEYLTELSALEAFRKRVPLREIIFCENGLSFAQIIEHTGHLKGNTRVRISANGSGSIVGSDSKDRSGETFAAEDGFLLADPVNLRLKRLIDMVVSLCLLLSFPLHLFTMRRPWRLPGNCLRVLLGRRTWIGYFLPQADLPQLRPGIIGSNGLPLEPAIREQAEALHPFDILYARSYSPFTDLTNIWKGYHFLGG